MSQPRLDSFSDDMQENSKNLLLIVNKLRSDSTEVLGESTRFWDLLKACPSRGSPKSRPVMCRRVVRVEHTFVPWRTKQRDASGKQPLSTFCSTSASSFTSLKRAIATFFRGRISLLHSGKPSGDAPARCASQSSDHPLEKPIVPVPAIDGVVFGEKPHVGHAAARLGVIIQAPRFSGSCPQAQG